MDPHRTKAVAWLGRRFVLWTGLATALAGSGCGRPIESSTVRFTVPDPTAVVVRRYSDPGPGDPLRDVLGTRHLGTSGGPARDYVVHSEAMSDGRPAVTWEPVDPSAAGLHLPVFGAQAQLTIGEEPREDPPRTFIRRGNAVRLTGCTWIERGAVPRSGAYRVESPLLPNGSRAALSIPCEPAARAGEPLYVVVETPPSNVVSVQRTTTEGGWRGSAALFALGGVALVPTFVMFVAASPCQPGAGLVHICGGGSDAIDLGLLFAIPSVIVSIVGALTLIHNTSTTELPIP